MKFTVLTALFLCTSLLFAADGAQRLQIEQRIQPVGMVHIQEEKSSSKQIVLADSGVAEANKKEPGQETYERFCSVCHRDGLAGAPKFQDEKDWKPRMTGKTIEDLVASATKGMNAMPAKGTCTECSEEDLKAAIQYMMPKS